MINNKPSGDWSKRIKDLIIELEIAHKVDLLPSLEIKQMIDE